MTDRYKGVVVTFDHDIRSDDAEQIISAILQLRGVIGVAPVNANLNDQINRQRIRIELREKLMRLLDDSEAHHERD